LCIVDVETAYARDVVGPGRREARIGEARRQSIQRRRLGQLGKIQKLTVEPPCRLLATAGAATWTRSMPTTLIGSTYLSHA
jgi:hypothetical protein